MHLKTRLISAAAFVATTALPHVVMAGGYVAPVIPREPVAASPQPAPFDWTGPYVGLSAGHSKIELNRRLIEEEPITVEHPAKTETITIEHPAETEEVEIPAVTEVVKHPGSTEIIKHPAETKVVDVPAVTKVVEHPAETEDVIETGKLWNGSESSIPKEHRGVCRSSNECPVPVAGTGEWTGAGWTGEWAEGEIGRTTVVIKDAWTETIVVTPPTTKTVILKEAWEESRITEPWTETVIVEPARTETRVVREAWTETKEVIVDDAWTEVVGTAYTATALDLKDRANTWGAFAGYRYQWANRIVAGVEANHLRTKDASVAYGPYIYNFDLDTVSLEAQMGYAMGNLLPYIALGYTSTDGDDGWLAAVGADYAITDRIIVGVKYTYYEYDDLQSWDAEIDNVSLRLAIKF